MSSSILVSSSVLSGYLSIPAAILIYSEFSPAPTWFIRFRSLMSVIEAALVVARPLRLPEPNIEKSMFHSDT